MRALALCLYLAASLAETTGLVLLGLTARKIKEFRKAAPVRVLDGGSASTVWEPGPHNLDPADIITLDALIPPWYQFGALGLGVLLGLAGNIVSLYG